MDYISYSFWMISKFSIPMCVQELSSTEWLYFHTVTRISYYTSNHLSSSCKRFPPVFSRLFKGGSRVEGNQLHKYHYRWVTCFFYASLHRYVRAFIVVLKKETAGYTRYFSNVMYQECSLVTGVSLREQQQEAMGFQPSSVVCCHFGPF